jgi:excisionase family DNA binding protein
MNLLSLDEAAKLLHLHTSTVRRWTNEGILRCYRINDRGDRRFDLRDIRKFLKVRHVRSK